MSAEELLKPPSNAVYFTQAPGTEDLLLLVAPKTSEAEMVISAAMQGAGQNEYNAAATGDPQKLAEAVEKSKQLQAIGGKLRKPSDENYDMVTIPPSLLPIVMAGFKEAEKDGPVAVGQTLVTQFVAHETAKEERKKAEKEALGQALGETATKTTTP